MRWGEWYVHDAQHVKHVGTGTLARLDRDLLTPATVCAFVELHDKLSAPDVIALLTCANELVWCAFDFDGIGDWVDAQGEQRGSVKLTEACSAASIRV